MRYTNSQAPTICKMCSSARTKTITQPVCRFAEAMEAMDTGKRLSAISTLLGAEEIPVDQKADLLEDLTEVVENIDHARDLHSVGGLPALVRLLSSPENELRWRAACAVAAACQSNPPVSMFTRAQPLKQVSVNPHDQIRKLADVTGDSVRSMPVFSVHA